jgi:tRNA(Arg) A34 adenosine deaminase TadA
MSASDENFLRLAIALAQQAREHGDKPFGAVLVEGGVIIHQSRNRIYELSDPTAHAELGVISDYCRAQRRFSLAGCTLYASAEPCPMCAGAIHWARIARVVYSVSQPMLQQLSGGSAKMSCDTIANSGGRLVEIVGPVLPSEGLAVFEGYVFPRSDPLALWEKVSGKVNGLLSEA